jgi:predicted neutral ceramidase superfamily lipid hydrolase
MTVYGVGQNLNVFLTDLGNRHSESVILFAKISTLVFLGSIWHSIRKQVKGRKLLYGITGLFACAILNPLEWFLPYGEFYQTVFLLVMVPFALAELRWKKLFTITDVALLFNVPLWHWSFIYWMGCLNAA